MSKFFANKSEAEKWVLDYLADCPDSVTTSNFHNYYTDDVRVTFENYPVMLGLDAFKASLEPSWATVESMKHDVQSIELTPTKILVNQIVTYVLKDDPERKKIAMRAFSQYDLAMRATRPIIEKFQVWMDRAPVAARKMEITGD